MLVPDFVLFVLYHCNHKGAVKVFMERTKLISSKLQWKGQKDFLFVLKTEIAKCLCVLTECNVFSLSSVISHGLRFTISC